MKSGCKKTKRGEYILKRKSKINVPRTGDHHDKVAKYMVGPFILMQPLPNTEQMNLVRYMFDESLDER